MALIDSPNMLQYLDTLLKYGNYTKAAKSLYISQPYLTQTIKKVEKELDIEIINRHDTPLQLTEAGRIYYQYLNSMEVEQDNFRKRISQYASTEHTIIRIGVLSSLGTYLLPLFLPTYLKSHPNVKIELHEAIPDVNEKKTLNGDLDFFIGQNPETISPRLIVHDQGKHGYYAIIPESSKLYQPKETILKPDSISIKELLKENLILTTHGSAIRRQVDYLIHKFKIQPNVVMESNNIFTIVALAINNLGVTFLPESVPIPKTDSPINIYKLPLDLISLNYFIAHPADKTLSAAETELIDSFLHYLKFDIEVKDASPMIS
ncbi:LysR family transcriptional regulator [Companilactobacillus sp. HBUAS59699]|uniref:LysR family transcriptional regulator n=1 Tax=Companilactobacillus sp. HBUAS59699 TaxID=3109358 RepID=UPI002FF17B08